MREPPVAAGVRPEPVRPKHQLALGVEAAPLLEEIGQLVGLSVGERRRDLVLQVIVLGRRLVKVSGVGKGVEEGGEVARHDVGHEPGHRLGVEDHDGGESRREEITRQDEVHVELETGVVQDDVHPPLLFAFLLGLEEQIVCGGEVVDKDVLFRCLASLGALQFLDILVGQAGQEGEVGGVAPEADLAHFHEQEPIRFLVGSLSFVILQFLDQVLVSSGELEHRRSR